MSELTVSSVSEALRKCSHAEWPALNGDEVKELLSSWLDKEPLRANIATLRQQLEEREARISTLEALLLEARDDVNECLNHDLPNAGYERYDRRIKFRQKHLAQIDSILANKSPTEKR